MQNRFNSNNSGDSRDLIKVLLVDDIPETRENIKKLLAFEEQEFQVIGSVGTGREAIRYATELKPDIVIMDINMPDMDGITATGEITKILPATAVIMMSVQSDADYLRKAMLAGARQFLNKPVDPDELYGTIRTVYRQHEPFRQHQQAMQDLPMDMVRKASPIGDDFTGKRAGHVLVVYSPQGGSGKTTIATNLASGLMKKNIKVLLIDADLQFGDVGVFLKINSQSTLIDLVQKVDDLDSDFFDSIVASHESGLKVLLGPPRPELAEEVEKTTNALARIVETVSSNYDFIVIDTHSRLDEVVLSVTDIASKIILVATPTLAGIKNARFAIDLFDRLGYATDKTTFILNRVEDDRSKTRVTIPTEVIEKHLKRQVFARIPSSESVILSAINKGVPVIATKERGKSPIKELIEFSDSLYSQLMGTDETVEFETQPKKRGGGLFSRG